MTVVARPEGPGNELNAIPQTTPTFLPLAKRRFNALPSDADLLAGCRANDATAWDELVGRYERLVYSVALRNGLSAEDAADATQNTFLALMNSLDQLQSEDRLSFWLMTVARRQAWRIARRRAREEAVDVQLGDLHDPIEQWERATVVHEALHRLGSPCRELLAALYFDPDAPSYAILAARLGRRIGGIGPMRGRCLQRLRALLDEDGAR